MNKRVEEKAKKKARKEPAERIRHFETSCQTSVPGTNNRELIDLVDVLKKQQTQQR